MNTTALERLSETQWRLPPTGGMHVPAILFANEELLAGMDDKVLEQLQNVATLPGIVKAAMAMPDAHWGYGFPIGGVGAFDPDAGGVVSAGGVGFDISCGVRTMLTGLPAAAICAVQQRLADALFADIPAGVGSTRGHPLSGPEMDALLRRGARWAVDRGYGTDADLERIEDYGQVADADPEAISAEAKQRQADEVGTLGSGNHYLEIQEITDIADPVVAAALGLRLGDAVVSIHCGSRGLGHQVATDYQRKMVTAAERSGMHLPERDLACAPVASAVGQAYLGAMRGAINCALANRQLLSHLVRTVFARFFPGQGLPLLYDVSHNTCKLEEHEVDGRRRRLYVHRKGATRAFGPGHAELPAALRPLGQPVLIGGTMGTASCIMIGTSDSAEHAFSSACHGAGRAMSRTQATRQFAGKEIVKSLGRQGILIRSQSIRGIAEEAPLAYKDVNAVVDVTQKAGLARTVAALRPLICVKG